MPYKNPASFVSCILSLTFLALIGLSACEQTSSSLYSFGDDNSPSSINGPDLDIPALGDADREPYLPVIDGDFDEEKRFGNESENSGLLPDADVVDGDTEMEDSNDSDASSALQDLALRSLQIRPISGHNIVISWARLAPDSEVIIMRSAGEDGWFEEIRRVAGDHARFLDLALSPESPYKYRLTACNDQLCGEMVESPVVTTLASHLPAITLTHPPDGTDDDLVLFAPVNSSEYYTAPYGYIAAVDRQGVVWWEFFSDQYGTVTELEPLRDHSLATAQYLSLIQLDLDHNVLYNSTNEGVTAHHDIDQMSDGRLIHLFFESYEPEPDRYLLTDGVQILNLETRTIDWEWHSKDHVPLSDYNAIDILTSFYGLGYDWTHANSITLDEQAGALYINYRNLNKIYKVGYPSGEVEWTMGKDADFGEAMWDHAHNPEYIAPGRMVIFDNGTYHLHSRVIEVAFDPEAKSMELEWEYRETPDFYCPAQGAAIPLENDHILVTDANNGRLFEITRDKELVWELRIPLGFWIYKAMTVPKSFFTEW